MNPLPNKKILWNIRYGMRINKNVPNNVMK